MFEAGQPFRRRPRGLQNSFATMTAISALMLLPRPALAGPTGGTVVAGSAGIQQSGTTTNINQSSNSAVINWQGFSIGAKETVNFNQPSAASATLNRVIGNETSVINGALNANGQVFIVNSAGVLFGKGSQVNVGGLVASTLDISNANFMAGRYTFSGSSNASVTNSGTIHASPGGYVSLLGKTVANDGVISANLGTVAMASGQQITLNFGGNSLVDVTIDKGALNALVSNKRAIIANGGQVIMTARAADEVLSAQVNNSGVIQARTMAALQGGASATRVAHKGKIKLLAQGGTVNVSGKLNASAPKSGPGGTVVVSGNTVNLTKTARLEANGSTGGTILVGGDRHGGSDPTLNFSTTPILDATTTNIASGATLSANGSNGNGGNIVIWSNGQTNYAGSISATGAGSTGNGGFVEVSSHDQLNFTGTTNLSSLHGTTGTLMLDPYDLTISFGADANSTNSSGTFTGSGNSSVINYTTLLNALANANVTISTGGTGSAGTGAGDININAPLDWSSTSGTPSTNSLTLAAASNINVNAPMTWSAGTLTLNAGKSIFVSSGSTMIASGTANFTANYGKVLDVNGNVTATATSGANPDGTPFGLYTALYFDGTTYGSQIYFSGTGAVTLNGQTYNAINSAADLDNVTPAGNYFLGQDIWGLTPADLAPFGFSTNQFTGNFQGFGHMLVADVPSSYTLPASIGALKGTNLVLNGMDDITVSTALTSGAGILTLNAGYGYNINLNASLQSPNGSFILGGDGANVNVNTTSVTVSGANIAITAPTNWTDYALKFDAGNSIYVNGSMTGSGTGNLTLKAATGNITITEPITWAGSALEITATNGSINTSYNFRTFDTIYLTQTGNGGSLKLSANTGINLDSPFGGLTLGNASFTAITTAGDIEINGPVSWAGSAVSIQSAGAIRMGGRADLTQTGSGSISFTSVTGITLNDYITLDNASLTANVTGLTGDIAINSDFSWSGSAVILTTNGGSISTANFSGDGTSHSQIGNGSLALTTNGTGTITLGNALDLGNGSLTATTAGGAISLNAPVTWSGSQVQFTSNGGNIQSIASGTLTQTGNGSVVLDARGGAGTGSLLLNGALSLGNGSLIGSTDTGAISLNAPVTWSGSQVQFASTSGSITTSAAATLTQTGNGDLTLNPGTGNLTLGGAVSLGSATSTLTGMNVTVNASLSWSSGQPLNLTATRDITINTPLIWSGGVLTLSAANNIYVNGDLTGTGSTVGLDATFGTGVNADGSAMGLHMGVGTGGYHQISLPGTAAVNLNGVTYSVITSKAQFDAISLSGHYVLGSDIANLSLSDFQPFGLASTNQFNGSFQGFGHSLSFVPGSVAISSSLALSGLNGAAIVLPFNGTLNVGGSFPASSAGGMVVVTTTGDLNLTSPLTVTSPAFSLSAGGNLNITASSFNLSNGTTLGLSAANDININHALTWSAGTVALTAGHDININNAVTVAGASTKLAMTYGDNYNIRTPASYSGVADQPGPVHDNKGNLVYETHLNQQGNPARGALVSGPVAAKDTSGGVYGSIAFTDTNNKNGLVINSATYTLIHTMSDLVGINSSTPDVNGYTSGNGNYALAGNLFATSNGTASGTPTVYTSAVITSLNGAFAGLGHTISNLTINASSTNNIGLIGQITAPNATIRDIGLINAHITGNNNVGALLGNYTSTGLTISQAYSTGAIVGGNAVGGLVGALGAEPGSTVNVTSATQSTVRDSYSWASVTGGGPQGQGQQVGGLIGEASGATIANTDATGNVNGVNGVGGLIGRMSFTTVDTSYATGQVQGVAGRGSLATNMGGLIGLIVQFPQPGAKSSVSNSFATGAVSGENTLGGLIGAAAGLTTHQILAGYDQFWTTVTNTYATGNVTLNDAANFHGNDFNPGTNLGGSYYNAGGLIGAAANVIITDSFATGNVSSNASTPDSGGIEIGGLVGRLFSGAINAPSSSGSITNSFATGNVHGPILTDTNGKTFYAGTQIGGLVGQANLGTISNSYATGNVAGQNQVGGLVGGGGLISNSFATGNVIGTFAVGGLVGAAANVTSSFATGNVAGISYTINGVLVQALQAGGLVGDISGSTPGFGQITNSWASGAVTGGLQVGGLVGRSIDGVVITNSYFNGNSGQSAAVGSQSPQTVVNGGGGLTGSQVKDAQFYVNGTINQVLADRAAAAAAAQAQAAQAAAAKAAAAQAASVRQAVSTANVAATDAQTAALTPPTSEMSTAGTKAVNSVASPAVEDNLNTIESDIKAEDQRRRRRQLATTASGNHQHTGHRGGNFGATIRSIDVDGQRFNLGNGASKQNTPGQPPH